MRWMFVLFALLGLAAYPAMAAPPVEKEAKELPTGQKQSQEKSVSTKPPEGSMVSIPAGNLRWGVRMVMQTNDRRTRFR